MRLGALQAGADRAEQTRQAGLEGAQRGDDPDGDDAGDQTVLNGGDALIVGPELLKARGRLNQSAEREVIQILHV